MSKNEGKKFEEQWKKSCEKYNTYLLRLIDSNKFGSTTSSKTRFTPENEFDCQIHCFPFVWSLELKSSNGRSLSFNGSTPAKKEKGKSFDIKPQQVNGLLRASRSDGNIAGLLLNYREEVKSKISYSNELIFIEINEFVKFAENCDKKSISRLEAREIGKTIPHKKNRTTYTYDIESFINLTSEQYMLNHRWNVKQVDRAKEIIIYLSHYVNRRETR